MNYLSEAECITIATETLHSKLLSKGKTNSGVSSFVLELVDEKGQGYFFKQGNTNYLLQKKLEKTLTNQGLIQPKILLATEKYMLIKGVNGKNMDKVTSRESKLKVAENLGEYLAILHKNNTRGWGELIDTNKGKYKTYSDFYTYLFPCIEPGLSECIKTVLKNTNTSCLNHGDVCYTHVFTNDNESFWGLIDFDDVLAAPYLYDLAEFHSGIEGDTELWERTLSGYCRSGIFIDSNSLEFLVNEYLINLDSWVWYKNQNNQKYNVDMQKNFSNLNSIAQKIKKFC